MGDWHISIKGVGVHHNAKRGLDVPDDADRMAREFVAKLKAARHVIHEATITTYGETESLVDDGEKRSEP